MTEREQIAAIGMEIRNLNARIESAEKEDCLTAEAEWAVFRLEQTLDWLQREGRGKRPARLTR